MLSKKAKGKAELLSDFDLEELAAVCSFLYLSLFAKSRDGRA